MTTRKESDLRSYIGDLGQLKDRYLLVGRSPQMNAITRIRATLRSSARQFFINDGWLEVDVDTFSNLAGACEDFSTLFSFDYYGQPAFLIQTGQQHLESYVHGEFNKVFTYTNSHRKETLVPERRLTSFRLFEAEAAHYNLSDIQEVQERLLYKLCADVLLWRWADLETLGANVEKLVNLTIPFRRITYDEAIEMLNQMGFPIRWGEDLKAEHEKNLGGNIGQPFFIGHYPASIKFFNMKSDPNNSQIVLSSDLLVPEVGEIAGASEREDDYEVLLGKLEQFSQDEKRIGDMAKLGITKPDELKTRFEWYLNLRRPGISVPHSGFGLGFERVVQWICDLNSILESTEYPKNKDLLSP